jgi:hypothetical protein
MDKDSKKPINGDLLAASENIKTAIDGNAVSILD